MSFLDALTPIFRLLPEVRMPEKEPNLKQKLFWSGIVLVLFFILGRIQVIGISSAAKEQLAGLELILASQIGTLITAGIGPIVLASIILQLLIGGRIIQLDLTQPEARVKFQSMQKLLAIILSFFEGFVYPLSGLIAPEEGMLFIVGSQIALGSIILLYLDEVVSKYGIGSGIGLFIAGGVAGDFFWRVFMPPGITVLAPNGGLLSEFIMSFSTGVNFLLLFPIIMFILIFLVIVYAEGMHVNIPITMGAKGLGGRYPVKLLYVSNMPVILAVALFANIRIWAVLGKDIPVLNTILNGLHWATTSQFNLIPKLIQQLGAEGINALTTLSPDIIQGIVYLIVLTIVCVVFGVFWVELGGQSSKDIARQLQSSGMYVPGFRRDERIIQQILDRYIPTITILGSIFVALLSGIGDMVLGGIASGTGILLTVGIVYRLYEEIAKEQFIQMHPVLSKFFK